MQVVAVLLIAAGLGAATGAMSTIRWGVAVGGVLVAAGSVLFVLDLPGVRK